MKTRLMMATAAGSLLTGCATVGTDPVNMPADGTMDMAPVLDLSQVSSGTGYFADRSQLPFHAPDFTQLSDDDFAPAFAQAMDIHAQEIALIKNNKAAPTFANTIVALEQSGAMLGRVGTVFFALTGANTNDTLDAIDADISPKLSAHYDGIILDPVLFARVKAVYDNRAAMAMTPEDAVLLEETYKDMVQAGAQLDGPAKEKVKAINTRLSVMTTEFSQKLAEATKDSALVVDTRAELAGLSDAQIDKAAKAAAERGMDGKYLIALQNTTQQPLLAELENRATREKLFRASYNRADRGGPGDTRSAIAEIAALRAEKAALFGKPDWASYVMYDRMAKTPKTALDFMTQMVPALAATQRREAALLNEQIKADGGDYEVKPWDWSRYAE
ncbi:Peptidyl-dipeptidase Dcp [Alteripontixanthobacter maritimus]|uniref:Peptidyl-dipeptidase Dcp n=1 Tax=Alteripontixanthobacter maritimus TaxID=2161824 RepID=A0A369Q764_9SPHN|nr:Peptidyl-dipeptidase Dcp [Alteripontixanthobacter maritimus]